MKLSLIFLMLLLIPVVHAVIVPDVSYIDVEWKIGSTSLSPVVITFTSSNGINETLNLALEGDIAEVININPTELVFSNTSLVKSTTISFLTSQELTPKFYKGKIKYGSSNIPVFVNVVPAQQNNTQQEDLNDCKLRSVTASDYVQTIKKDAGPFTQKFTVKVSSKCVENVDVSDVILLDTIHTEEGMKPIRLTGPMSLGEKDAGEEISFNVLFDVTGLESGVYSPILKVVGTYKDNLISAQINFQLTVTTSSSPVLSSSSLNPIYTVPDVVATGQEFEISVLNIDPNYVPMLQPNPSLIGVKVTREPSTWKYTALFNDSGDKEVSIAIFYLGGQIGSMFKKKISVTQAGSLQSTGLLKFDFFPPLAQLRGNEEVAILTRDNGTNNIVESTFYLDGVKLDKNKIITQLSKQYCLSAVSPTYSTADICFSVQSKLMAVTITPLEPITGEPTTFSFTDGLTNEAINPTLYSNGLVISNAYLFPTEGLYNLSAKAEGYSDYNFTVDVKTRYLIVQGPNRLNKNDENLIKLNKAGAWKVVYYNSNGESLSVAEGNSDAVIFTPKEQGRYDVLVGTQLISSYQIKGFWSSLFGETSSLDQPTDPSTSGNSKTYLILFIVLVLVAVALILVVVLGKRGNKRVGFGVPSLGNSERLMESI